MGRQNNDQAVLQSSILLLQERFRKLQRLKEMREEQEYQRMFSGGRGRQSPSAAAAAAAAQFEQPKWFFHSDLVRPSRPLCEPHQESSHGDQTGFHEFETASSMSLPKMTNVCCSLTASESDVDTSLHL